MENECKYVEIAKAKTLAKGQASPTDYPQLKAVARLSRKSLDKTKVIAWAIKTIGLVGSSFANLEKDRSDHSICLTTASSPINIKKIKLVWKIDVSESQEKVK